jgi:hypothetical protein
LFDSFENHYHFRFPMTAERPASEASPAVDALAFVAPTTVITQYEVLVDDINEAKAKAAEMAFDLTDKKGIAAAKSYVFSLRRLNGRIDDAHKEAKAETLERGKAIDRVKNVLREQVAALIQPHQDALDAIAKAEAERVAKHRQVIDTIKDMARLPFGFTSQQIAGIQEHIKALDMTGMEEFEVEAKAAWADTMQELTAAHATAVAAEEKEAELTRLREEARLQAEKEAAAKAAKEAEDAAAEVARKAQEAADAAALQVIEEAEQKVAAAQAEAAAATRRALDAEAVADALQGEALLAIKPAEAPVLLDEGSVRMDFGMALLGGFPARRQPAAPAAQAEATAATAALVDAQIALRLELMQALSGRTRSEVAEALIAGTLHHAVKIDWAALALIPDPTP